MTDESTTPSVRDQFISISGEMAKVVVGQAGTVSGLLVALLSEGHVLLEGVPGVAKTLLIKTMAAALDVDVKRVQFTPDFMPSDVLGQMVFENGDFRLRRGPVFTNLLIADEINRTPPKTQAALLEAMEERQVSIDGRTMQLPDPFMVVATQNPVEYEGTYPLPEAQLDRFLMKLAVGYPSVDEEVQVLRRHHGGLDVRDPTAAGVRAVANAELLAAARREVAAVKVSEPVLRYIVEIARATRVSDAVSLGASPRGATALLRTSMAWTWLVGKPFVTPDEVQPMVIPTLRHRLAVRPELEIDGVGADEVLSGVVQSVQVP